MSFYYTRDLNYLYEKCLYCWHFIECNNTQDYHEAAYVHLDSGDKEHDHDAAPSGDIGTLMDWMFRYPKLFYTFPDNQVGPNSVYF